MNVPQPAPSPEEPIVELVPVVRRVVAARISDPATRDDIVQETLARVMASRSRVEQETLVPYAIATARNLIASLVQREQRARRNAHLLVGGGRAGAAARRRAAPPGGGDASSRPPWPGCRRRSGRSCSRTRWTARTRRRSRPAAAPRRVRSPRSSNRTRSRLRVEYLVAQTRGRAADRPLPAGADRAVARVTGAGNASSTPPATCLACDFCAELSTALFAPRPPLDTGRGAGSPVSRDADVVTARQKGREVAAAPGSPAPTSP